MFMIRLCVKVHLLFVKAKDNVIKISTSGFPKCLKILQNTYDAFMTLPCYTDTQACAAGKVFYVVVAVS